MSEIPQWAINEALKRCGVDPTEIPFADWRDRTYAKAVELFAAHIAEHEEPPVDPLLIEARKLVAASHRAPHLVEAALNGTGDGWESTALVLSALRRGIEIGKQS